MMNNHTIEVMLSTMHQKNEQILETMNIKTDAVVINQCSKEHKKNICYRGKSIFWIDSSKRGLSRSRNDAIKNSKAQYLVIADDDLEYMDSYEKTIITAIERYPDADIFAFQVEGIEKTFKRYRGAEEFISYRKSMNISSVELVIKRDSIIKNNISFDEMFGAGSVFSMGEENIFLFDCLKKKLKIVYIPEKIANLHITESSWFAGYNEKYFFDRGATYNAMFGNFGVLMGIAFCLKKYKRGKYDCTLLKAIKNVVRGYRAYSLKK